MTAMGPNYWQNWSCISVLSDSGRGNHKNKKEDLMIGRDTGLKLGNRSLNLGLKLGAFNLIFFSVK